MRAIVACLIVGGTFAAGWRLSSGAAADQPNEEAVRIFMRGKLDSAKDVLEGLVTEDFDQIAKAADRMLVMSKRAEWNVIKNERYAQYSAEFQRANEQLAAAGREKKIDAAALAWVQVTMNCVNCHQHARGVKVTGVEVLPPESRHVAAVAPKEIR